MNDLTVQEYQILKGIIALDQETRNDLLTFLQTHTGCDNASFSAGLNELLAKQKRNAIQ